MAEREVRYGIGTVLGQSAQGRVYSGNPLYDADFQHRMRQGGALMHDVRESSAHDEVRSRAFDNQRMSNEQVRHLSPDDIANLAAGHAMTIQVLHPNALTAVIITLQPPRQTPFMYGPDIAREMGGEG